MTKGLLEVAKKEGLTLAEPVAQELAKRAENDMRRAVNDLQSLATQTLATNLGSADAVSPLYPWQHEVRGCAQMMMGDLTAPGLMRVRTKVLELLAGQLPATMILSRLVHECLKLPTLNDRIRVAIIEEAARVGHQMHKAPKDRPIFQIEDFVAQVMSLFEQHEKNGEEADV